MKPALRAIIASLLLGSTIIISASGLQNPARAHEGEFSAGEPGNPDKPARVIQVSMRDGDGKMSYVPAQITVHEGDQIRFIIRNDGVLKHEFVLASVADYDKHAKMMMKNPDMEHDDPNAVIAKPGEIVEMLWRFDKAGTFEFACLIPGHREAGMHGTAIVK